MGDTLNSVAEEITRLNNAKNDIRSAINELGEAVPENALLDEMAESIRAVGGKYLPLSGGTMSGTLTLSGEPETDLQAATKKYVDDSAVQSDWSQSDATKKDYIKNKPFGFTSTWSKSYEGSFANAPTVNATLMGEYDGQSYSFETQFYKVSDLGELTHDTTKYYFRLSVVSAEGQCDWYVEMAAGHQSKRYRYSSMAQSPAGVVVIVYQENTTISTATLQATFPEKGVYAMFDFDGWTLTGYSVASGDLTQLDQTFLWLDSIVDDNDYPVKNRAIKRYVDEEIPKLGIASGAVVGQLAKVKAVDENGVPTEWETGEVKTYTAGDGIAISEDGVISAPKTTETWTFTLANGSTVTKTVVIGS